jgi:hypothetical protein
VPDHAEPGKLTVVFPDMGREFPVEAAELLQFEMLFLKLLADF